MNDRFLIVKYIKEFIYSIDEIVINFPRKDFVIKDSIMKDSLNILEMIYIANLKDDNKSIKIEIIAKLNMLDFYIERCFKKGIISEKICKKKACELEKISKLVYGWIRSDSKCK